MEENPNPSSNEHIGTEELARLLEESRSPAETVPAAGNMHRHLAACSTCREQFEELASLDRQLSRQLNSLRPQSGRADCPAQTVWSEIAGGVTPPDETLAYIAHASRCDHCGPLLRDALAKLTDLNREITEEERSHIASLESARAEWQQNLAQRISGTPHTKPDRESTPWWQKPWWQKWLSVPRLALAGASLLAMVGVGLWFVVQEKNQPAAALLARAYTERRTLELRIAGAAYAPLRVSRGPIVSFTDRPTTLSKAEALIASQLESHPSDPSWLQAKAQADLLDGKYQPAVEALRRALELEPNSPALLIDLASAYFQRAQSENKTEDFGAAYETLSQALKLQPDNPVALFNRALVAEQLFLYRQALDDWNHYLGVDPRSQWADEAQTHAKAVQDKLNKHQGNAMPLLSPAEAAARLANPSLASEVDPRIEEYLHEAVRSWLPQAFPETGANEKGANVDPRAEQALFFLADLTNKQHNDRWLADLLRGSSASRFPQAVSALARAVKANDAGDYDVSRQQAGLAGQEFRASGNTAGILRAQFEQTFAAQMTRRSEDCRRQSITAGAESRRYSYPWLQIQLGLEEAVCSALMGDLGARERATRWAHDQAQQSGYGALDLRALGFVANSKRETGDRPGAWRLVCSGLESYWSGQFPAVRGFNLYAEEALAAEAAGQSYLRLAIWREAVALIDCDEVLLQRAMAHSFMADAATAARRPKLAEQQYGEAAQLFAAAPRTQASRDDALETGIRIARLQAHLGRFEDAIAGLTSIQAQIRALSNNYLAQSFYSTLGEVQLRSHHAAEAGQAFRAALRLAEQNLASLTSEADRTRWSKDAAPVYLGLAEAELVQGHEQESLDVFEWYLGAPQRVGKPGRAMSQHTPELSQSLPDPTRLPARLPLLSNQTVLAYGVLPEGLAIWIYDDRGVSARWIPQPTDSLQGLAERFNDLSSDPKSELSAVRRDARSLYESLIAPVEQHLAPGRTLVIEADGWLARVPFEALLDSNGRYLVERVSMVHSLGQDSQAELRSSAGISADLPSLVVGSSASSPVDELIPLPDVAAEADIVARGFHFARVLKGQEVTLSAVRTELPRAAVFHFAGHSLADSGGTGLRWKAELDQQSCPA